MNAESLVTGIFEEFFGPSIVDMLFDADSIQVGLNRAESDDFDPSPTEPDDDGVFAG